MFLACIWRILGDVWSQIDRCALDDRLALRVSDGETQTGSSHLGEADDASMTNGGQPVSVIDEFIFQWHPFPIDLSLQ